MDKSFDESKHPRDATGKFTEGVGTKAEQEKLEKLGISTKESKESSNLNNEEKRLEEITGEKVENVKQRRKERNKQLVHIIKNFDPIPLKIGDKKILAEFDTFTANKNIFAKGNSDKVGVKWKKKHIEQLPKILKSIKYVGTSKETGKNLPQHKGVKQWHYFRLKVRDGKDRYALLANVREKGKKFHLYEIKVTKRVKGKKKYKKRV